MANQGKLLRINLSNGLIEAEFIAKELLEECPGGCVLAKALARIEDVSAENNKLIFAAGALNGTGAPASALCDIAGYVNNEIVCATLPLHIGPEIKFCGYDALIIEGKAEAWCYILINGDDIKILPAEEISELTPLHTEMAIRSQFDHWRGNEIKIVSIGEASSFSSLGGLITDGFLLTDARSLGNVFAEKNLKAIAIRGIFDLKLAQPPKFNQLITEAMRSFREEKKIFEEKFFKALEKAHVPLFTHIQCEGERRACFSCPIACLYQKNGQFLPNFEGAYCFSKLMGINVLKDALDIYKYCFKKGIDLFSLGLSVRMLIEIGRKGVSEIYLKAGDKEGILKLLKEKDSLLHKGALFLAKEYQMETEFEEIKSGLERIKNIIFSQIEDFDKKIKKIKPLGFCPYILFAFPHELLLDMYQVAKRSNYGS